MRVRYLAVAAALAALAPPLAAQSAAEHIALGDKAHAEMQPAEALTHYEEALKIDSTNYEALWKASRTAVDIAEFDGDKAKRGELYRRGERYARAAIQAKPDEAEGHFNLARALGRVALTLGKRDRVKYARDVREHALAALKYNPDHPGALHVMGRWNAEVMRLSGMSRFMAKNFLGGKIFDSANWEDAKKYMQRAVEVDPDRLTHHLDLAEILLDTGDRAKAREHLEHVVTGKQTDYNDRFYKQQAEELLKKVG